jgi:hypothetical protein
MQLTPRRLHSLHSNTLTQLLPSAHITARSILITPDIYECNFVEREDSIQGLYALHAMSRAL